MGAEEGMVVSRILEKKNISLFNTNLQYVPPPGPLSPVSLGSFSKLLRVFLKQGN